MFYDNQPYWTSLHEKLKGEFRAVGHPFLSEELNRLKYESEAKTVLTSLKQIVDEFKQINRTELSILDVGAGYGYWTAFIYEVLSQNGFRVGASALDISPDALDVLKQRLPYVRPIHADLKTIAADKEDASYDLVSACYCFHHLTRAHDFLNAIQFAAHSVKKSGFLLIMDPVLTRPFSKADTLDFPTFQGNGIPRHLYFVDDVLAQLGMKRCLLLPAVSFLLNGNIEAPDMLSYYATTVIWKLLCRLDRIDRFTQTTAGIFRSVDSVLKQSGLAYSSSVWMYQKT